MARISIFRAGRHKDSQGRAWDFGADDLRAAAAAYDPNKHEAPLVIGHPGDDAPAYGWVKDLRVTDDGHVEADFSQVEPAAEQAVRDGRYKKVSASWYNPDHPRNPAPGRWYLRHVGLLGAQPPAVQGLPEVRFASDDDAVTLEFAESEYLGAAAALIPSFLRRFRDWLLANHGQEAADQVLPSAEVEILGEEARREPPAPEPAEDDPEFSETPNQPHQEDAVNNGTKPAQQGQNATRPSGQQEGAPADFAERERQIDEREKRIAEQQRQIRRQQLAQKVDGLVDKGQVLPRDRDGLVAFMEAIEEGSDQVAFSEGDEEREVAPSEWLMEFLGRQPAHVDFNERAGGATPETDELDAEAKRLAGVE
ncbi:MAG: peptidase [Thiohalospira sp.]